MSLMCLAYIFDMLSTSASTTRHWQTSGRLVQELNVCTVELLYRKISYGMGGLVYSAGI